MLFLADNERSGRASLVKGLDRIKVGATRMLIFIIIFFGDGGKKTWRENARTLCVDLLLLAGFFFYTTFLPVTCLTVRASNFWSRGGAAWETDRQREA